MRPAPALDPRRVPSAAGAVVIATAIVSVALYEDGQRLLAILGTAVPGIEWAVLAGVVVLETVLDPEHLRARAGSQQR